jgi:hypothetical protein
MRKYVLAMAGLVALCLLAALGTASGAPDTVTVNSTTDVSDGDTSTIIDLIADPGPDGAISLREAIEAANNNDGSDTIEFHIPAADAGYEVNGITNTWTISLTSALPCLSDGGTIISGTTQAANMGGAYSNPYGPEIEISGAGITQNYLFCVDSAENVIHGLVINASPRFGIWMGNTRCADNIVSGNYIGTDAAGASPIGNGWYGIYIAGGAHDNVIGGQTPGERNVISGNGQAGVGIVSDTTMSNTVCGNYIGTDGSGTTSLGNGWSGVHIASGAKNNTIGPDNTIAYNSQDGVYVTSSGTTGNTITQNSIHSNGGFGIELGPGGNDAVPAPSVGAATACFVMGTAGAGDLVEVFTGPDEEGKTYVASSSADVNGSWIALGSFTLDTHVTATTTDSNGNTSKFSLQVEPKGCRQVFACLVMKSY